MGLDQSLESWQEKMQKGMVEKPDFDIESRRELGQGTDVCMYVCVYACVCVCVSNVYQRYIYRCMKRQDLKQAQVKLSLMYVCMCMYVCVYLCVCVYMCVSVCMCMKCKGGERAGGKCTSYAR